MAAQAVEARPNTQEMVIVHRVFRREYRLLPQMVAQVADGDVTRAGLVAAHLTELGSMLHHHHSGEDELVWPRLTERAELSGDLVRRMEEQHARVGGLMHRVDDLVPQWTAGARADVRDSLADVLAQLSQALDEHLAEEEREVLPLIERHLTAAEWSELGERGMASIPKARMLVLLGHILEETSPQERKEFLALVPPPARVLFRLVGQRRYAREVTALRQGVVPQQRRG